MIKITAADKWFSLCVRERGNWTCARCKTYYPEGSRNGIECSHWVTRGNWSVRFSPLNAEPLCTGCHFYLGSHPRIHEMEVRERLGSYAFAALEELARDITLGRRARREKKQISDHYRAEYRRMCAERSEGRAGRIEFMGYL